MGTLTSYMLDLHDDLISEDPQLLKTLIFDALKDSKVAEDGALNRFRNWLISWQDSFVPLVHPKAISFEADLSVFDDALTVADFFTVADLLLEAQDLDSIDINLSSNGISQYLLRYQNREESLLYPGWDVRGLLHQGSVEEYFNSIKEVKP